MLAILKRPNGATLRGTLRVGCGGKGGSVGYSGANGIASYISLYDVNNPSEEEKAEAEGGYGGKTSYNGDDVKTGAGGSGGGYKITCNNTVVNSGYFIEKYSADFGVSGLPGGQAGKARGGAYYSARVYPENFSVHNTSYVFGSNHSQGLTYYEADDDNDGGCGGDSIFSPGGPGCTEYLTDDGYGYSYIPNCTIGYGSVTEDD